MTSSFIKSERFEFVSCLGTGAMGVVYEVYDREKGEKAAIKTLRTADPQAVYRLKKEFGSLQDLQHRNFISLGELFETDGQWYFTMELVEGVDFVQYAREFEAEGGDAAGEGCGHGRPGFDEARLRDAFRQLAEGLSALHDAGRVHRDIKPSNVLVDRGGRLVLMDFGIALNMDAACLSAEHSGPVGTAAYMAPEQASTEKVGPEADWYSAGVMLYEALTGRLPFKGTAHEIINAKHSDVPPRPQSLALETPEDLDELCMRLLHRDQGKRPDASIVLSVLKGFGTGRRDLDAVLHKTRMPVFAGREKELGFLYEKFKDSARGAAASLIRGESGLGKSALLEAFSQRVYSGSVEAAVLIGRCSRTEPVRFNAFEGVVNNLKRFLIKLPEKDALSLVPGDASFLLRVFPVLSGVEVLDAGSSSAGSFSEDVQMVRTLAFDGLRELLTRLAEKRRVLLIIDDFQWADRDSIRLLRALFRPPGAPSVCLVLSLCTPADAEKSLMEVEKIKQLVPVELTEIEVGPLPVDEAVDAARMLLMNQSEEGRSAERLGRLSGGRPLLLKQLVRYAEEEGGEIGGGTLEDVLEARTAGLEPQTRRLLELVCISGSPIGVYTPVAILGEDAGKISRRVAQLRWMDLVKSAGPRREDLFEPYHELVRCWAVGRMDPEARARLHGFLIRKLKSAEGVCSEMLAVHLEEAGEARQAARLNIEAALEASKQFAFDRAATLYRKALASSPRPETSDEVEEMRRLIIGLAESLVLAGRGSEAADAYLKATEGANAAQQLRLEYSAAWQLLVSGKIDKGLDIIDKVAKRLGVKLPRTPWGTLFSLLRRRIHIRVRGLRFRLKDPSQVSPEKLERVDLWRSVTVVLGLSDNMRSADFNTRWIMKALEVGEPDRVMQALALELVFIASLGKRNTRYYKKLRKTVSSLLETRRVDVARAYIAASECYGALMAGDWRAVQEPCERFEGLVMDSSNFDYELASVRFTMIWSQFYLGELDAMTRRLMPMVRIAMDRGDVFAASGMFLGLANIAYLNRDGPEAARSEVDDMISMWVAKGYHLQHYFALLARVHIALYKGCGKEALDLVESDWSALRKSLLLLLPSVANEGLHLRGRALAAAAAEADHSEKGRMFLQVEKIARRLGRRKPGWIRALALLLGATVHVQRDDIDSAVRKLEAAVKALDELEMSLYAAAARWRLAELVGGDAGGEHQEVADRFMKKQKIRDPESMVNLLAPGFTCVSGK